MGDGSAPAGIYGGAHFNWIPSDGLNILFNPPILNGESAESRRIKQIGVIVSSPTSGGGEWIKSRPRRSATCPEAVCLAFSRY